MLEPVEKAEYDATISVVRRACTEGTRRQVLSDLLDWALDPDNDKIYWLNGMAGTGKTTLAYSFSQMLKQLDMLGGTFFCSRNDTDCGAAERIPLTIAFQLAKHSRHILEALTRILNENLGPGQNISVRFDRVIVQPLCEVSQEIQHRPIIVIIDALDECTEQRHVDELLAVLWKHAALLPIKFLVTSRPDPQFHCKIYSNDTLAKKFHLHDVEKSFVQEDIHLYVQEQLGEFMDEHRKWSSMLSDLVKRADRLFIYAATACHYVRGATCGLHVDRLKSIVGMEGQPSGLQTGDVDKLYMLILCKAYEQREEWERQYLSLILQAIVCIQAPLSVDGLAEFLDLKGKGTEGKAKVIRGLLSRLHAVICVPDGSGPVTVLHASFPDHLAKDLQSNPEHYVNATLVHHCLAQTSFHIMNKELHFNICNIGSSFLPNNAFPPSHFEHAIRGPLSYACRFWGFHLEHLQNVQLDLALVTKFMKENLLFWFEALSGLRALSNAVPALADLHSQFVPILNSKVCLILTHAIIACSWYFTRTCVAMNYNLL